MSWRSGVSFLFLLAVVLRAGPSAHGEEKEAADRETLFPTSDSLIYLDLSGSFRLRTELLQDAHMGLAGENHYGIYPQLSKDPDFAGDASAIRESTDLRLRLEPTFH